MAAPESTESVNEEGRPPALATELQRLRNVGTNPGACSPYDENHTIKTSSLHNKGMEHLNKMAAEAYNDVVEGLRQREYPMVQG